MPPVPGTTPEANKPDAAARKYYHNQRRGAAPAKQVNTNVRPVKFEGRCNDLKGHIFDCRGNNQADQFSRTKLEIINYVGTNYRNGADTQQAIEAGMMPNILMPTDPASGASLTEKRIWEKQVDQYVKRLDQLGTNLQALYALVWGQCTDAMHAKVKAATGYTSAAVDKDGLGLLTILKDISFNFQSQRKLHHAIHVVKQRFFALTMGKTQSPADYLEQFTNTVDMLEHVGASVCTDQGIADLIANGATVDSTILDQAKEEYLAVAFFLGADPDRYGMLIQDAENDYGKGQDSYPKSINDAYKQLCTWKHDPKYMVRLGGIANEGVMFAQPCEEDENSETVLANVGKKGNGNRYKERITCFNCYKKGHYSSECKEPPKEPPKEESTTNTNATNMLMSAVESGEFDSPNQYMFAQENTTGIGEGKIIPKSWVLLDNQSTIDVFCNPSLLTNIRKSSGKLTIHCNAGEATTNMIGEFDRYGTVWYHANGIANVLSLSKVKEKYQVTYDSLNGNTFVVHKHDGSKREFAQSKSGLFFYDTSNKGIMLINTVAENKLSYTNIDYTRALLARKLQITIGRPSTRDFIRIVETNQLPNCPITRNDILAAEHIFGPDIGSIKGKTVRQAPNQTRPLMIPTPLDIMERYKEVTLCADIMFVNKIPFLITMSRNIKFITAEMLLDRKGITIMKSLRSVLRIYRAKGFKVSFAIMDGEFENLRGDLSGLGVMLNTTSNNEDVGDIERMIRTIKERCRGTYTTLPFAKFPARLVIEMVYSSVFWLNSFSPSDGVSNTMSPRTIVTGQQIDFNKHCQLEFGTYVQTHEEHDNSMLSRTTGAIALRPTGNAQGGYYFMSLSTGRRLNRYNWTILPMPHEVIDRVHTLARRQSANRGLLFLDRAGNDMDEEPDNNAEIFDGDDDDSTYAPSDEESEFDGDSDDDDDDESDDGEADGNDAPEVPEPENQDQNQGPEVPRVYPEVLADDNNDDEESIHEDADIPEGPPGPNIIENDNGEENIANDEINHYAAMDQFHADMANDEIIFGQDEEIVFEQNDMDENEMEANNENEIAPPINIAAQMAARYGERQHEHGLRPRKPRDYGHKFTTSHDIDPVLHETLMTQYSLKKGIQMFGDRAIQAVLSELRQLHTRKVMIPVMANELTYEQRKAALAYLMFLKEKRCGTVKGRGCADGRKQRLYTNKEDSSSPTVANESLFISSTLDAHEKRDVATADLPGAFLHSFMDEIVHMRLEGTMVDLVCQLDPELYTKYVTMEGNKKVLYVLLNKALYGTLRAALLFWRMLTTELKKWGFILNPYDCCVANKMINGKQCTILWHVDDLKISHVDKDVVTQVLADISKVFGIEAPLTITRGHVHDYLGMKIDFSSPGKVIFSMIDYIDEMLLAVPEDMSGEANTPASNHLFEVSEKAEKLSEEMAELFHHYVAKLLFLCKRARPDIQTAVAFLCTRVKSPDTDDYKKLSRVIKYLRGTRSLPLTLEADGTNVPKWWVDASYATHPDMKSHTGGALSLGKGIVYGTSTRQKLVTRSSTEAELVGVADVMPQLLWTRYFLEAQGYPISDTVLFQDNKSTILLAENGRASSGKRTRHINIRYFFVADRVQNKELHIEYCPTEEMVSDFFTKPLQGIIFRKFRDLIMNVNPEHFQKQNPNRCINPETVKTEKAQDQRSVLEHENSTGWVQVQKRGKQRKAIKWAASVLPGRPCKKVLAGTFKSTAGTYSTIGRINKKRNNSNRVIE